MTFFVRVRSLRACLVAAVVLAANATTSAQRPVVSSGPHDAPLEQAVPVDPRITVGTLPNGMRYYIRKNARPAGRAEIRLAVKAGSVLEDDDQRGLAHFVEHMAFNGTEHFPKQDVVAFLQSTGMRFGAHINANTSFDQTIYQLVIPTEKTEVIDRSLLILEDWARAVSFEPEEIDKERGVILEEWRTGLGAGSRILEQQLPVLLKGSRYAERMPIGTPETLRTFPYEKLKKFYTDWYRPDLMAVVIVGDFDPAVVEPMIRAHFGQIPMPASPRPRPKYEVPEYPGTRYTVVTDPEAGRTTVSVSATMAARDQTTIGAYRQGTLERMFSGLLSARLSELGQKPDAPYLDAGTSRSRFVETAEITGLNALVADGGVEKGLAALFTENARVAQFGFTQTELDRYKQAIMQSYSQLAVTREEHLSDSLADEFVRNFMQDEPIPGIAYENALVQRFIPEITLAEVNALARDWMPDRNRVVAVSAPKKDGVVVPDEAKLTAVIKGAGGDKLTAYVDTVSAKPLLEPLPKPGKIANTATKAAAFASASAGSGSGSSAAKGGTGITEWTLSNGVRVILQPTTFKQDEILFNAFSPGGTSLATDSDFVPAETADQVVPQGGLGALSGLDLGKKLTGKSAIVRPQIDDMSEGLSGRSLGRDLETMFQLIYLTFTQPRADAEAFSVMKSQLQAVLANRDSRPEAAFADTLNAAVSQNHLRARPMSAETVAKMDLAKSMAFYKDRFADASDFTFVFVGSFDLATMKPLVEKYLASLPSLKRKEAGKDVGIRPPAGVVEKTVTKGREPRSQVGIVFTGPFKNTRADRLVVRTLADTLEGSLQRVLREDLGGTYGVSVEPDYEKQPTEEYRLTISFACDPARTDDLVKALFSVIDDFKTEGPSAGQLSDVRAAGLRDLETDSLQNGFVLRQLAYAYEYGEEVPDLAKMRTAYDSLTPSVIRDAARTYLDTNRYVKVVLMPEGK